MKDLSKKYDIRVCIVNFSLPTRGTGKLMDKSSFEENVYLNPAFRKDMADGKIHGLLTHAGRNMAKIDPTIPYEDNMLRSSDRANLVVNLSMLNDAAYADLVFVDTEAAKQVKDIIKSGGMMGVSMSTHCDAKRTDKYYIKKLLGVDFTQEPAFKGTGISDVNFSNVDSSLVMINFSGSIVDVNFDFDSNDFSLKNELYKASHEKTKLCNFSLKLLLKEARFNPIKRLRFRIDETIRTLRGMNQDNVNSFKPFIRSYLDDLVYNWIARAFEEEGRINLSIGLRLNSFIKDSSLINSINKDLNLIKIRKSTMGYIDKINQKKMSESLNELFASLWKYVEAKSEKKVYNEQTNLQERLAKNFSRGIMKKYVLNKHFSAPSAVVKDSFKDKYVSIEEWLNDIGNIDKEDITSVREWAQKYPKNPIDKDGFKKEYLNDEAIDELIKKILLGKVTDDTVEKLRKELIGTSTPAVITNFDADIANRTLTDADIEAMIDKMKESGMAVSTTEEEDTVINDQELPEEPLTATEPIVEQPPAEVPEATTQPEAPKYPKPKVVSEETAAKLTSSDFSLPTMTLFSYLNTDAIETEEDIEVVAFSLGISTDIVGDYVKLQKVYKKGLMNFSEYSLILSKIKTQLKLN